MTAGLLAAVRGFADGGGGGGVAERPLVVTPFGGSFGIGGSTRPLPLPLLGAVGVLDRVTGMATVSSRGLDCSVC